MKLCECGCKEETQKGNFKPGHDQKLRISIENSVGGLLNLRDLIASIKSYSVGKTTINDLQNTLNTTLKNTEE